MTTFDDRLSAFESEYAHNEEVQFKAKMRRDRFLAVWAATLKGDDMAQTRALTDSVIHEDVSHKGSDHMVSLLNDYLGDRADETTIRAKLDEFMNEAKEQIARGI